MTYSLADKEAKEALNFMQKTIFTPATSKACSLSLKEYKRAGDLSLEKNSNGYINLILSEIDKIKKDILSLDSNYTFEDLDYFSFKNGKEIIDYLNQKYIEYYRVYLDFIEDKVNEENYENSKVPLSY